MIKKKQNMETNQKNIEKHIGTTKKHWEKTNHFK